MIYIYIYSTRSIEMISNIYFTVFIEIHDIHYISICSTTFHYIHYYWYILLSYIYIYIYTYSTVINIMTCLYIYMYIYIYIPLKRKTSPSKNKKKKSGCQKAAPPLPCTACCPLGISASARHGSCHPERVMIWLVCFFERQKCNWSQLYTCVYTCVIAYTYIYMCEYM